MARYEHLPIYKKAYDLNVYVENIVRHFSRYHKYTLGTDLRNMSRNVVGLIVKANNALDKKEHLMARKPACQYLLDAQPQGLGASEAWNSGSSGTGKQTRQTKRNLEFLGPFL